jgi:phosphoribosyl 1,2-cyclic phosphate phosphodiesterase
MGGPSLRKRSSLLVDGNLLIDLGPDLVAASQMHRIMLKDLRYCLQTHEHEDHLDPSHLGSRGMYPVSENLPRLDFYATRGALEKVKGVIGDGCSDDGLPSLEAAERVNTAFHLVEPFQTLVAGPYRFTSVPAAHDPALAALLWIVEKGGRTLFYGTDTGPLPEETWELLREKRFRFDIIVLDHTFGLAERSEGHMNAEQFLEQISRLRKEELVANRARILAHHIGHHSNPPHPELVGIAAAHGYEVAHDGLRVEV